MTNGKGEARMVSEGNAMTILIDGKEAFGSAADDMEAATTSLNMTQLFFTTPDYKLAPADEHPKLVFSFGPPTIVPLDPLPSGQEPTPSPDRRTAARSASCSTRLAARSRCASCSTSRSPAGRRGRSGSPTLPAAVAGLGTGAVGLVAMIMGAGVALLPVFIGLAIVVYALEAYFVHRALDSGSDVPELKAYMAKGLADIPQPRGDIIVRGFEQPAPDNGVLHTKMVIADGQRATVLGSPYSQRYFDDPRHQIDNPERGNTTSDIVHDVSVGLVGPVVGRPARDVPAPTGTRTRPRATRSRR